MRLFLVILAAFVVSIDSSHQEIESNSNEHKREDATGEANSHENLSPQFSSRRLSSSHSNEDSSQKSPSEHRTLRVMTFNIWNSGRWVTDGLAKIAKHIRFVDPDIVALEEVSGAEVIEFLLRELGDSWSAAHSSKLDTALLTKHKFLDASSSSAQSADSDGSDERRSNAKIVVAGNYGTGATIELDDSTFVNMFALHLDYRSYGPYAAQNKLVNDAEQIMAGELSNKWKIGRGWDIKDLLANDEFKTMLEKADSMPLIVAGDFNCPSHLDWVEETKEAHGGWVFEWPATKLLEEAGFLDSFRELHPNVTEKPGITWSTVQKHSGWEWDYSIDLILYKSGREFAPVKSFVYAGKEPLAPESEDYQNNDYPSDHFAVVTEFEWTN